MLNSKTKTTAHLPCLPVKPLWQVFHGLIVMALLFSPVSVSFATGTRADYADAHAIVNKLHEKLLFIMQNAETLGYQGRYNEIRDIVLSSFDTPLIAKVIMSRYWKKMDEAQKTDFIKLFRRLSVATYAARFNEYSGEKFVELSTETLKKGRLLIKTQLQRAHEDPVELDYLMHEKEGQWFIISVIANGVNDLSLKRAEYATVIKDKGFEGLVKVVAGKITDMKNHDKG